MDILRKIWEYSLDLVFPKKPAIAELEQTDWQNLRSMLPRAENSLSIHGIFPLFNYRHESVRAVVWDIKYRRNSRLGDALARLIYDEMLETIADMELFGGGLPAILVPIPMSDERRRERGFNQTELLASLIHRQSGASLAYDPGALIKTRHTRPQAELTRAERLENLKGAFGVPLPQNIAGRNIILIDDVSTTGATIREAASVLKLTGARTVIAFTIAH